MATARHIRAKLRPSPEHDNGAGRDRMRVALGMDPIAPMEALLAEALPDEPGWQFEPKWDGFRCIAVRDGARGRPVVQVGQAARALLPRSRGDARPAAREASSCSTANC